MKIAVAGMGHVGMLVAYNIAVQGLCDHLLLVNRSLDKAHGHALDILHALTFTDRQVEVGACAYDEAKGCDIVVLCASVKLPEGSNSRADLAEGNAALFREIVPALAAGNPGAIFVIVSNPVEILTYLTLRLSGAEVSKVMGIGTIVDSARFRKLLSAQVGIHPDDLRAYILGEHGEHQFPVMSCALSGGERIDDTPERRQMAADVVRQGFDVFYKKGWTDCAVSMAATVVIRSIVDNECRTLPVCTLLSDYAGVDDVCLSVPAVIGRGGIRRIMQPDYSFQECRAFARTAAAVKARMAGLCDPQAGEAPRTAVSGAV